MKFEMNKRNRCFFYKNFKIAKILYNIYFFLYIAKSRGILLFKGNAKKYFLSVTL